MFGQVSSPLDLCETYLLSSTDLSRSHSIDGPMSRYARNPCESPSRIIDSIYRVDLVAWASLNLRPVQYVCRSSDNPRMHTSNVFHPIDSRTLLRHFHGTTFSAQHIPYFSGGI